MPECTQRRAALPAGPVVNDEGDSPMVHASLRPRGLLLAGLVLGALFAALGLAEAQQAARPRAKAARAPAAKPAGPTSLKLTIVAGSPDVAEMSKVINDRLEASWKANKLTPSHYIDDHEFIRRASLHHVG